MQTEKLRLNNMTINLPAKTAMATVVPAVAAAEMVVVGSRRRVWMWRQFQSLQRNDTTNTLAIMKLLATRWQKHGGDSGGGGGGGSTAVAAVVVAAWWWRQHGSNGSSIAAAAAVRWQRQRGSGSSGSGSMVTVAAA